MKLIVGLGNPGSKYENTRHNLGARVIDAISSQLNIEILFNKKMCAYMGRGYIDSEDILLIKPQFFVNQSGVVIRSLVKHFNVPVYSGLIVLCDDMDLPVGKIRIRKKGSSGGHKGLESIIKELGESNFVRIRMGIGRPLRKKNIVEYVLSSFKKSESGLVRDSIARAIEAITTIVKEGVEKAMNIYNKEGINEIQD